MPTDMEGAKNAGIKSVLVDRRDSRDYPEKIKDLTGLKNILKWKSQKRIDLVGIFNATNTEVFETNEKRDKFQEQ